VSCNDVKIVDGVSAKGVEHHELLLHKHQECKGTSREVLVAL